MPGRHEPRDHGQHGGIARSFDGNLTVELPAGALREPTLISIGISTHAPLSIGSAYRVQPTLELDADALITYHYAPSNVTGRVLENLAVEPGDPDASFLWHKLNGTLAGGEGDPMPDGGPQLPAPDLATFEMWILGGAQP